jgi:hypothetical protein
VKVKRYPKLLFMNAKSPTITPLLGLMPGFGEPHLVHRRFSGLYEVAVLGVVLCLVYLEIPLYISTLNANFLAKDLYYAFFVAVAPLLILRFRSLISYVISPFSLWALGYITLDIIHLLFALIFGIALWTSLAVILWKGKYFPEKTFHQTVVTGFVFLSMFTHNMFDYLYWFLTFALVSGQRRA